MADEHAQSQHFPRGAIIFNEGEPAACAYVIQSGSVSISALRNGVQTDLGSMEAGELLGELPLLDHSPRSATARAMTDTRLLPISRAHWEQKLHHTDPLVRLVLKMLLKRFRRRDGQSSPPLQPGNTGSPKTQTTQTHVVSEVTLANHLYWALERGEFELHYQPIVQLESGAVAGFEALLRWKKSGTYVPPLQFIPMAEELGLIEPIGLWVLRRACEDLKALSAANAERNGCAAPPFMSINLSAKQIHDPAVVGQLVAAIRNSGIDQHHLKLEVTESAMMKDPDAAVEALSRLKELGPSIALDDFGTGYSSLSYLQRFPVDILKIDRSFVASMTGDAGSRKIVSAIAGLAHELGLASVAEGIETVEHLHALRQLGCTFGQGYLLSRPLPLDQATAVMRRGILV